MPLKIGASAYWHERAGHARAMAEDIEDPEAKQAMLAVAMGYEKIAQRAEARELGIGVPPSTGQ